VLYQLLMEGEFPPFFHPPPRRLKELLKKWFWSAKACRSEAEIPPCGAFAVFKLVRELEGLFLK